MAFLGLFGNFDKPGPGVSKDEPPKAAPIRFFEIFFRKFSKLVQANLIFVMPVLVAAAMMVGLYFFPTHIIIGIPSGERAVQLDIWAMYVVPLPLILLSPFQAGLAFITRNFAREEHAFVWSDFWESVRNNWKYFLLNGAVVYLVYFLLSFSIVYYYNAAAAEMLFLIPFWICVLIAILFLFAQYYLPIMFITFDLKFGQFYRNAFVFTMAGFGRNLLVTLILGVLVILIIGVIPIMPLTVTILLFLFLFIFFSFSAFLISFSVYPVIDQYMIKPYERKLEEEQDGAMEQGPQEKDPLDEKYAGLFSQIPEEEEEAGDQYVYVNGKLIKQSGSKSQEDDETGKD